MRVTKHHGLGNDFLVALDERNDGRARVTAELAVAMCDRRSGMGADGLIHGAAIEATGADLAMVLFNRDGSRAEISGNGIRCLGQAVASARGLTNADLVIDTDAGSRALAVRSGSGPGVAWVSAEMGAAAAGPTIPGSVRDRLGGRAMTVDMGNPHLVVLVDDPAGVDLAVDGPGCEADFEAGINVEFVRVGSSGVLDMVVWERGVGITNACGSGACASAHAAHQWGLVDTDVAVRMPGGTVRVELGDQVVLSGDVVEVAGIDWPDGEVEAHG